MGHPRGTLGEIWAGVADRAIVRLKADPSCDVRRWPPLSGASKTDRFEVRIAEIRSAWSIGKSALALLRAPSVQCRSSEPERRWDCGGQG